VKMAKKSEPKKILVIDDEPHLVEVIASRLRANQYEVFTAVLGLEGLEKARNEKPDLILLDILMPDADGYQVLRQLKEDMKTKEIPVVMLTAHESDSDRATGFAAGAIQYLTKPFGPLELIDTIRGILAHS